MTTDSIVFYRSFFEAVEEVESPEARARIYKAIFEYGLDGKTPDLKGAEKAIFKLIKPQIDANFRKRENGGKGGRPKNQNKTKAKPNHNQDITNPEPNVNANVNANVNVNDSFSNEKEENDTPAPGKKTSAENKSVDNSQRYGLYNNVILSDDERDALMNAYPDSYAEKIDNLSAYMVSKNKVYHNHFATIMKWAREDEKEQKQKEQPSKYPPRQGSAEDLKNFSKMLDEIGERMKGKNNDV